jgi:DNA-3-methyladenine glycosylase II
VADPIVLPRGALVRLCRADPALGPLIARVGAFRLAPDPGEGPLASLVRAIVYQQLSGSAAATIHGRLRSLWPPGAPPAAGDFLAVDDERLRACGLSRQKISYLRALCEHVAAGSLQLDELHRLGDDEIIAQITRVRGLGRWTAQMHLMFHLGRLDVWPHDDLGVRKGLALLRGSSELLSPAVTRQLGELFRPYRSVVAWYLWRSLDPA